MRSVWRSGAVIWDTLSDAHMSSSLVWPRKRGRSTEPRGTVTVPIRVSQDDAKCLENIKLQTIKSNQTSLSHPQSMLMVQVFFVWIVSSSFSEFQCFLQKFEDKAHQAVQQKLIYLVESSFSATLQKDQNNLLLNLLSIGLLSTLLKTRNLK